MQQSKDYYEILGVSRNATDADIRRAFRLLAKSHHPDAVASQPASVQGNSFREITEAYDVLKDHDKRRDYDEELTALRQIVPKTALRQGSKAFGIGLGLGLVVASIIIVAHFQGYFSFNRDANVKNQEQLQASKDTAPKKVRNRIVSEPITGQETQPSSAYADQIAVKQSVSEKTKTASLSEVANTRHQETQSLQVKNSDPADIPSTQDQAPEKAEKEQITAIDPKDFPSEEIGIGVNQVRSKEQVAFDTLDNSHIDPKSDAMLDPNAPFGSRERLPTLKNVVVQFESAKATTKDAPATNELVRLVASSESIDDLLEALQLARKAETKALITQRLASLQKLDQKLSNNTLLSSYSPSSKPGSEATDLGKAQNRKSGSSEDIRADNFVEEDKAQRVSAESEVTVFNQDGSVSTETFTDCRSCPVMISVPTAFYSTTKEDATQQTSASRKPLAIKPFAVSRSEITIQNWRDCVSAGGCRPGRVYWLLTRPDLTATGLSWYDAKTYITWLSSKSGKRYRLLTETEWEYVTKTRRSPAGEYSFQGDGQNGYNRDHAFDFANYRNHVNASQHSSLSAKGLIFTRHRGMEWVDDCADNSDDRQRNSALASPYSGDCTYRIIRGLSSSSSSIMPQTAERTREFATLRAPALGFRVAVDMPEQFQPMPDRRDARR